MGRVQDLLEEKDNTTITDDTTASADHRNKLKVTTNRRPDACKHLNGGRGKQFMFHCWNDGPGCGVNCTHNTDRCCTLLQAEKLKHKDATFLEPMGGSNRNLKRFGRFQRDCDFDCL